MATLQLTVEQVSFENLSHDSFSSVVDPNVDFGNMTGKKAETGDTVDSDERTSPASQFWPLTSSPGNNSHCKSNCSITDIDEESKNSLIQRLCEDARDGALSEADFLYSYDSLGSTYPNIPLPAAQHLTQHNPDSYTKLEDILNKSDLRGKNISLAADNNTPPSPLKSMASTSEALALQHTVIGNSKIKPVSPEIVAEVVANTRLKLTKCNTSISSELPVGQDCNEGSFISSHDMGPHTQIKIFRENGNLDKSPDGLCNELIEYPARLISATVEKKPWLSSLNFTNGNSDSSGSLTTKSPKHKSSKSSSRRSSNSSVSSLTSTKGSKTTLSEVPETLICTKNSTEQANVLECTASDVFSPFQDSAHAPFYNLDKQETESCLSDKLDAESFSESYETESNLSEISGVDDEMLNIRKLLTVNIPTPSSLPNNKLSHSLSSTSSLLQASSCTDAKNRAYNNTTLPSKLNMYSDTVLLPNDTELTLHNRHQPSETDNVQHFEILRIKFQLEGEVEQLKKEMEDIVKDRSKYQTISVSLQSQLQSHISQIEMLTTEKEKIMQELESAKHEHKQWDNIIVEYQSVIDSKTSEIKALKEDLSETETEKEKLKINLEEMKVDMESKEGAVVGLKKKIAELHVEVQMLLQGKVQLENEVKNIQAEMGTLQKSKVWYQEQLYAVQESRNRVHQELITTQAGQVSLNSSLEHLKVENSHIKQQLQDIQHKAMKEKEVLMKHLEAIEADMMEREALFQEIQRDKGSAEEIIAERAKKVEEDRSKLTSLSFQVSDLKHQLDITKKDVAEKDTLIQGFDKEKAELAKQVALLQKSINDRDLQNHLIGQDRKEIELKLKHAEVTLTAKEEHISILNNEKTCIEVALAAANEEKRIISEALKNVKENLNRVENNFKHMKAELISRSSQVEQLLKEKMHLEDCLQQTEDQLFHQKNSFRIQTAVSNQNQDLVIDDLNKQKTSLEKIVDVLQKDLQRQNQICAVLQKEKENFKTQMLEFQKKIQISEETVQYLHQENKSLQEKNSSLQYEQPQGNIPSSKEAIRSDKDVDLYKSSDDKDGFNITYKDFEKKQRIYESNIKVLTRKLREKMKECKNLQNELKKLENAKEMSNNTENYHKIKEIPTVENKEEEEYKKKVIELQEELKESRRLIEEKNKQLEQNQNIILDLEKEKGRLTGVSDSQDTIKLHIKELEASIAGKDAAISQLEQELIDLQQKFHDKESKTKGNVGALELEINKEKALIKELRHQIFQEKRENSQMKRHISSFKTSLEHANQVADARKQELIVIQSELAVKHQAELKHRAEIEQLQSELRCTKMEQEKMKKEQEEISARDPALAEQIKSISWHLKEKNQEVTTLKEQLCLIEERHNLELARKNKQIESLLEELQDIKSELTNSRKEKFSYQAKSTELRRALKSSIEKTKRLESCLSRKSSEDISKVACFDLEIPEPPAPFDDSFINSLLKQSLLLPESRPLSNLQACLSSLKQEMTMLQKQLDDHTEKEASSLPAS